MRNRRAVLFGGLAVLLAISLAFNAASLLSWDTRASASQCAHYVQQGCPPRPPSRPGEGAPDTPEAPPQKPYERVKADLYVSPGRETYCDGEFNWAVLNRIRANEKVVCDGPASTVSCAPFSWENLNEKHARHGSFCQITNVAIVRSKVVPLTPDYYDVAGQPENWLQGQFVFEDWHAWFPKGSVVVSGSPGCDLTRFKKPKPVNISDEIPPPEPGTIPLAGPLGPVFWNALTNEEKLPQCDIWFEEPFVAVGRREANSHLLFGVAEGINALVAAKAFLSAEELEKVRILYLDAAPYGFTEAFFYAVGKGGPIVHMLDYMGAKNKTLCFKKLITTQFAYSNFLVHRAMRDGYDCRNSQILKEYRDRVLTYLNITAQPYPTIPSALFIARHFNFKPTMARVIVNENQLVEAMKKEVAKGKLVFDVVEMEKIPLRDQIAMDQKYNIVVGPHGMGMMHFMFSPDDTVILEVWPRGYNQNTRHRNIARLLGHSYLAYEVPGRNRTAMHADVGVFREMMDRAVHLVRGSFRSNVERCGLVCPSNCTCHK